MTNELCRNQNNNRRSFFMINEIYLKILKQVIYFEMVKQNYFILIEYVKETYIQ